VHDDTGWIVGGIVAAGGAIAAILKAISWAMAKRSEAVAAERTQAFNELVGVIKVHRGQLKEIQDREERCQQRLSQLEEALETQQRQIIESQVEVEKNRKDLETFKELLVGRSLMIEEIHTMVKRLEVVIGRPT
jgi:septal ring factor EnvC (AmiA/AmiB activator)